MIKCITWFANVAVAMAQKLMDSANIAGKTNIQERSARQLDQSIEVMAKHLNRSKK